MTFGVTAQVVVVDNGWTKSIGVPAFRIDAFNQAEAEKIAADIINPTKNPALELHLSVVPL